MEGTKGVQQFSTKDLVCPQLYQQLAAKWPYSSDSCPSFACMLDSLLRAPPITTLRVNTLKCTDTSAALSVAEKCLGRKGFVDPRIPDVLVFTHVSPPSTASHEAGTHKSPAEGVPPPSLNCVAVDETAETGASPHAASAKAPMVVVGPQCGQSVLRGSHVFAPGLLAAERGVKEGALVEVWAVPRPFKRKVTALEGPPPVGPKDQFEGPPGQQAPGFLKGAYITVESRRAVERWGIFCGLGVVVQPLKDVFLTGRGVAVEMRGACDLSSLPPLLVPQHLPSAVVGHVLAPLPGELVADLCAAPGHKTSHLAALMQNEGILVALDRSKRRVEEMQATLDRLGATMVECVHGDSAKDKWQCSLGPASELHGRFDRVLADVTCTGLGLRPRLVFDDVDIHSVREAALYQREFLKRGCELLRPGGVLVYSTCSISWDENEGNVQWAQESLPLKLEPAEPFWHQQRAGVRTLQDACKVQRFCPCGETIGFFIAKLKKMPKE
ncbi:hypothetical protein Esti_003695 [Eimeria stiedai]